MEAKFQCFSFQMAGDRELPGLGGKEGEVWGRGHLYGSSDIRGLGLGVSSSRGRHVREAEKKRRGFSHLKGWCGGVFRCNGM